jgi:hypothetical protein
MNGAEIKVGDTVVAQKMPADSFFTEVIGTVTGINNGYVSIQATVVKDRWSKEFERHPSACATGAKIEHVTIIKSAS